MRRRVLTLLRPPLIIITPVFDIPSVFATMIKIRLRHPKGVTSLDLDPEASIMVLTDKIFSATEIPPAQQECECLSSSNDIDIQYIIGDRD